MKRKMIVIIICMLFFISALPAIYSSPNENNDVDISITAGRVGLDIGFDIHIKVQKPDGVPMIFYVNITHSSIFGGKVDRLNWSFTCEEYQWGKIFKITPSGIFNRVNITVEVNTIFGSKYYFCGSDGFSIGRLHFLNRYVPLEIKKEAESNLDEDCDCSHVTNSGRPICDKIQQWIYTFNQKLEEIVELLEQYKHNPILTRLYVFQALFLMGRVVHFQSYWFLLGCNS